MSAVQISVVIPVRNKKPFLRRCLEALRDQDAPPSDYEVIVVDNGSTEGSDGFGQEYPWIRFAREPEVGSYAARNCGIRLARGPLVAFTDADCVAHPDWISRILTEMQDTDVGVAVGVTIPSGKSAALSLLADYQRCKGEHVFEAGKRALFFGQTNNLAVRKELFDRLGCFPCHPRGSDSGFVQKVARSAPEIPFSFCPRMLVTHLEIESATDYWFKLFTYGRSRRLYGWHRSTRPLPIRDRFTILSRLWSRPTTRPSAWLRLAALMAIGWVFWQAGMWTASLGFGRATSTPTVPRFRPQGP